MNDNSYGLFRLFSSNDLRFLRFSDSLIYEIGSRNITKIILAGKINKVKIVPKFKEYYMGYRIDNGELKYEKSEELKNEFAKIKDARLKKLKATLKAYCKSFLNNLIKTSDFVFLMTTSKDHEGNPVSTGRLKFYQDILSNYNVIELERPNTGPVKETQVTKTMFFVEGPDSKYKLGKIPIIDISDKYKVGELIEGEGVPNRVLVADSIDSKDIGTILYTIGLKNDKSLYYKENILYTLKP